MNKGDLVEAVYAELGGTKVAAARAVDAVLAAIATGIRQDTSVSITGFGTFTRKDRAARTGRNPSNGAMIEIKASRTVGFKPSPVLKDTV